MGIYRKLTQSVHLFLLMVPFMAWTMERDLTNEEINARAQMLRHSPWNGVVREFGPTAIGECLISRVEVQVENLVQQKAELFAFYLFSPANPTARTPMILHLPNIEGPILEPAGSLKMCLHGFSVAQVDAQDNSQPDDIPAWGHEDRIMRQAIIRLRTILDWAEQDSRFDSKKFGLLGQSLGGITAALLFGVEHERIKAMSMVVASGNFPAIVSQSTYPRVKILAIRRMKSEGIKTQEEYYNKLTETVKLDPLAFKSRIPTDRVFMLMASLDTIVPFKNQMETYEAFGRPEFHIFSPGTHFDVLLRMATTDTYRVIDFFDRKFQE